MPEQKTVYCGVANLKKNQKRGNMKECALKGEIKYYGLKKVDKRIIELAQVDKNYEKKLDAAYSKGYKLKLKWKASLRNLRNEERDNKAGKNNNGKLKTAQKRESIIKKKLEIAIKEHHKLEKQKKRLSRMTKSSSKSKSSSKKMKRLSKSMAKSSSNSKSKKASKSKASKSKSKKASKSKSKKASKSKSKKASKSKSKKASKSKSKKASKSKSSSKKMKRLSKSKKIASAKKSKSKSKGKKKNSNKHTIKCKRMNNTVKLSHGKYTCMCKKK